MASDLETLVNIGPKLAADLRQVGVPDAETLHRIGATEAAQRLADAGCATARMPGARWRAPWPASAGPGGDRQEGLGQ